MPCLVNFLESVSCHLVERSVMTIPEDILAANATGRIPDGVSLSYLAQSRDRSAIVGILFMVCFAGLLVLVRLYARLFLVKKLGLDDALAVLTMVCALLSPKIDPGSPSAFLGGAYGEDQRSMQRSI